MGKYGDVAVRTALRLARGGRSPREVWDFEASVAFPDSPASQKKGCPRGAFLGLCEAGLVVGVPAARDGTYTDSQDNKRYAVQAVRLLAREPTLAARGQAVLWDHIMGGLEKRHNSQMDVVLSLLESGLIALDRVPAGVS